jgi:hypothetical protein
LSEATRPALGSLFTTLSWHDELSAKELEVGRDLPSLPLKSMPKSFELLPDCTLTLVAVLAGKGGRRRRGEIRLEAIRM